jgi:hypothetical protein
MVLVSVGHCRTWRPCLHVDCRVWCCYCVAIVLLLCCYCVANVLLMCCHVCMWTVEYEVDRDPACMVMARCVGVDVAFDVLPALVLAWPWMLVSCSSS